MVRVFGFIFVHAGEDARQVGGDFLAHFGDEFDAVLGDSDHDLTTIFGGVDAFDVAELFEPIDQAGGGGGGVAHFFRDVGHRQILLARQIRQEEELGERDVPFIEFGGQIEDAASLCEQDEVRESVHVGRRRHAAGTGVCFHVWLVVMSHARRHELGRITGASKKMNPTGTGTNS